MNERMDSFRVDSFQGHLWSRALVQKISQILENQCLDQETETMNLSSRSLGDPGESSLSTAEVRECQRSGSGYRDRREDDAPAVLICAPASRELHRKTQ